MLSRSLIVVHISRLANLLHYCWWMHFALRLATLRTILALRTHPDVPFDLTTCGSTQSHQPHIVTPNPGAHGRRVSDSYDQTPRLHHVPLAATARLHAANSQPCKPGSSRPTHRRDKSCSGDRSPYTTSRLASPSRLWSHGLIAGPPGLGLVVHAGTTIDRADMYPVRVSSPRFAHIAAHGYCMDRHAPDAYRGLNLVLGSF